MTRIPAEIPVARAALSRRTLLGFGLAVLAASCAQTDGGSGTDGAGGEARRPSRLGRLFAAGLTSSQWRFVEVLGKPIPGDADEKANVLSFTDERDGRGTFSAGIGCNRMGGRFRTRDDEVQFRVERSTKMTCSPELDMAERRMVAALGSTSHYRLAGDRVELVAEGQVLATLMRL